MPKQVSMIAPRTQEVKLSGIVNGQVTFDLQHLDRHNHFLEAGNCDEDFSFAGLSTLDRDVRGAGSFLDVCLGHDYGSGNIRLDADGQAACRSLEINLE